MEPGQYKLKVRKNRVLDKTFTWKIDGTPVDLTGYTAKMQIRRTTNAEPILQLTESDGITLGGNAGTIRIKRSPAQTALLIAGLHVWDLELIPASGDAVTLLEGAAAIEEQVSR